MERLDTELTEGAPELPATGGRGLVWVRLLAGIAILGWLLWRMDWQMLRSLLPRVSVGMVMGCALFYAMLQTMSATKWQMLLRAQGVRLPLRRLVRFYFTGMFFNLVLPTLVGGDAVRAYLAWRETGRAAVSMSSILVERVTGFVAMLAIGVFGAMAAPILRSREGVGLLALGLAAIAALGALVAVARLARKRRGSWFPFRRKLSRFYTALRPYGKARFTMVAAMAMSFAYQSGLVVLNLELLRACGYDVPLAQMAFYVPVVTIASMVPVSINGLGIRETTSAYLFQQMHLPAEVGLITSLLWRVVVLITSLPGGLLWLRAAARDPAPLPLRMPRPSRRA